MLVEQGSSQINGSTTIIVNIAPYTIIGNGHTVVSTAGSAVQLSTGTIKTVTIRAYKSNTGLIYVGSASVSSSNGFELAPSETVSLDISSLGSIYLDADVNGNGVSYVTLS